MRQLPSKTVFLALLEFVPVSVAMSVGTAAGEFCVSCAGPDAHYACTFDGADDTNDASLKLLCITELAKSGKHASCSVDRAQVKPCTGVAKAIALPDGYQIPAALPPPSQAAKPSDPLKPAPAAETLPPPENAAAAATTPPKTVKEMVEKGSSSAGQVLEKSSDTAVEAAKSTGSTIGKIGKAASDAAKKTWTCITSLFGSC